MSRSNGYSTSSGPPRGPEPPDVDRQPNRLAPVLRRTRPRPAPESARMPKLKRKRLARPRPIPHELIKAKPRPGPPGTVLDASYRHDLSIGSVWSAAGLAFGACVGWGL